MLYSKTERYLDWPVKKVQEQDCTHVDYNPLPFKIIYPNTVLDYKATILVYMILYGKGGRGSNWLWTTVYEITQYNTLFFLLYIQKYDSWKIYIHHTFSSFLSVGLQRRIHKEGFTAH